MTNSEWDRDLVSNIVSNYIRKHGSANVEAIKGILMESGIEASTAVIESRVKMYLDRNGAKKNA
jgi:hypothetical protein